MPPKPSEKPTYFLCSNHKRTFIENIDQAIVTWARLIQSARKKSMEHHWQQAVIYYGNAFEIADIIYSHSEEKGAVNRYIETTIEFIYALRHSDYIVDFDCLINEAEATIQQKPLSTHPKFIIKPLNDMAFSPIEDIERWISFSNVPNGTNHTTYQRPALVIH